MGSIVDAGRDGCCKKNAMAAVRSKLFIVTPRYSLNILQNPTNRKDRPMALQDMANDPAAALPGQPAPDMQQAQQPAQGGLGESVQASPEEQQAYEHFIGKSMELIYNKQMLPQVLSLLQGEGDPIEGLARASALVIGRVASAAQQAGEKLSGDVLLHAGTATFEDLANLASEAGIHDFGEDQDGLEGAYFKALDLYREMLQSSGQLDEAAAAEDLNKLMQADKDGQLEAMFRRLAEEDAGGNKPPNGQEPPPDDSQMPRGGLMQGVQ
ncbi:hypothetical protein ACHMW7_16285 [Aminobacter sp. UC22_36]|uniref:hypothetical protein n=1 Tax=Aminobacter sp. UC22_36 TaxID=3374549 RepID=UPI003756FA03